MTEDFIRQQANNLRRSYNPQQGFGLNGTTRQSLTGPQQLDRLLTGIDQSISSASNELQRRSEQTPDTIVGTQQSGDAQRKRMRQLMSYKECETDACITRRSLAEAVNERQRANIRQLDKDQGIERPTRSRRRQTNSNGRVSPSNLPGRRNWRGAGRPKGS